MYIILLILIPNSICAFYYQAIYHRCMSDTYSTRFETSIVTDNSDNVSSLNNSQSINLSGELEESMLWYHRISNSTEINTYFKVPKHSSWPIHLHGFKLGSRLKAIASDKLSLEIDGNELIFTVKNGTSYKDRFNAFLKALVLVRESNSGKGFSLPENWVVPSCDPWPKECWGLNLSNKISQVRYGSIYNSPEHRKSLDEIGFIWDPNHELAEKTLRCLQQYKSLHGNLNISINYSIPSSTSYSSDLWGIKLGKIVGNIRYRGDYAPHHEKYKELGLDIDRVGIDTRHWEYVFTALKEYKQFYGHLTIPKNWTVPSSPPWSEDTWKLKLGYRANNIKYRGDFVNFNDKYRKLLTEIGFPWNATTHRKKEKTLLNEHPLIDIHLEGL